MLNSTTHKKKSATQQKSVAINADLMSPIDYQEIKIEDMDQKLYECKSPEGAPEASKNNDYDEDWWWLQQHQNSNTTDANYFSASSSPP